MLYMTAYLDLRKSAAVDSSTNQIAYISPGSDGSLTLSLLGLSVCLVSHNLLYSGLKKAHSKLDGVGPVDNRPSTD